jgi:hypothetical protein
MFTAGVRKTGSFVAALSALLLVGCGPSKVAQCNELAEVVNQTQGFMTDFEAEIQTFSENASTVKNLDDIKSAASQYTTAVDKVVTNLDTLSQDLQSTSLNDETLMQFRDDYVQVVNGFSTALTDAREAMNLVVTVESEDDLPARIEESQQQTMAAVASIEELSTTEAQLIGNVNSYCGAAPATAPDETGEGE